jgi:hypothetical protein
LLRWDGDVLDIVVFDGYCTGLWGGVEGFEVWLGLAVMAIGKEGGRLSLGEQIVIIALKEFGNLVG